MGTEISPLVIMLAVFIAGLFVFLISSLRNKQDKPVESVLERPGTNGKIQVQAIPSDPSADDTLVFESIYEPEPNSILGDN